MGIELQKMTRMQCSHRSISTNEWRSTLVVRTHTNNTSHFRTILSLFQMMASSIRKINPSPTPLATPNTSIRLTYHWRSSNREPITPQLMISHTFSHKTKLTLLQTVLKRLNPLVSEKWWWRRIQVATSTLTLSLRLIQDPWDASRANALFDSGNQTFMSLKMTIKSLLEDHLSLEWETTD